MYATNSQSRTLESKVYTIIHPLDDVPEKKIDVSSLGRMPLTPLVKFSLGFLRLYISVLIVMAVISTVSRFVRG